MGDEHCLNGILRVDPNSGKQTLKLSDVEVDALDAAEAAFLKTTPDLTWTPFKASAQKYQLIGI